MTDSIMNTYKGNCHCGSFKFELNVPEIKAVTACDCSICFKKSYLWTAPTDNAFRIVRGAGVLISYQFGAKDKTHKFCPICGSGVLVEDHTRSPGDGLRINVRMLMDVNPFSLKISSAGDQKCSEPAHFRLPFQGEFPTPNLEIEGSKFYTGGCHCGAVSVAVKSKPLREVDIREDNCSICQRNANVCIYPHQSQVNILGKENCTEYSFGRRFTGHCFCKICGVPVYMELHGPPKAIFDSWSEARKNAVRGNFEILPLRVRLLNDVEWDEVSVKQSDDGSSGYTVE